MTKNYLLFIRQEDFIDLFKFEHLYAPGNCVEFNGDLEQLKYDTRKAEEIFKKVNNFEYSNDYFLLHVAKNKLKGGIIFKLSDVVAVIALDDSSYENGLSLSPAVKITPPIWQDQYLKLQERQMLEDAFVGINNVASIFGINMSILKRRKGFPAHKEDNTLKEVIHDNLVGAQIAGEHSLWYYLLRYERHQSYPSDTRGYLLDVMHVYANFIKKRDLDTSLIHHPIGQFLMAQKPDMSYDELCNLIPISERIYQDTENIFKGFINIAVLFLMLKDIFIEGLIPNKKYREKFVNEFANELEILFPGSCGIKDYALYLLGAYMGRANTYKYIYMTNKDKYKILL